MQSSTRSLLILAATGTAVLFWSLKPVFVRLTESQLGFAETFLVASSIALVFSLVTVLVSRKTRIAVGKSVTNRPAIKSAAISGLLLAVWYYCYYRALHEASMADATIIAFTWPLVAVIATPIVAKGTAPKLTVGQWALILLAFFGACLVGVSGSVLGGSGFGILWAFAASLGSGIGLPFAVRATQGFSQASGSSLRGAYIAISIGNAIAFFAVLALALVVHDLDFNRVTPLGIAVCALIGLGIYLYAEMAWTWAFKESKSLTLASLPYLVPAVSIGFLYLFFREPVTVLSLIGLVLVVGANFALHFRKLKLQENTVQA